MALWDKIFKKKDETPGRLNPIVQKSPPPAAPTRVSSAKPAARPAPAPAPAPPAKSRSTSSSRLPKVDGRGSETKSRKKKEETGTRSRPGDDAAFLKRGMTRQQNGEHDAAIADFTKAIELNPDCVQAYASRGLSKDAKGDVAGAKSDYSKSIQIQIMVEINRQMRENPDVEV
ncbi:MAG TPA: tetratricopeptide repeat protein [Planctomycetota bacterium]|nr:tetratricopeptide repeat protein [Planctomycetota bacterium]